MSNNAKKKYIETPENTNKTCFEAFWEILENSVLGSKIWFSAQISNYAKIPWNTQKTPTKHVLRLFKKFLKIRFSAQKSGSRPRCRTMLEILWNTQKTPTKHVLRLFKNFLKIWFSAQKSGSRLRCRTMLKKIHWNTRKHQQNMFWGFLRILENSVLGSKMWFSAQISNYAKIPWNTQKTPTKHVLRLFKKFLKIRFSAQKSGSRPRCRTMLEILWNTQKTPTKHALRHFKKFLKIRFLAEKSGSRLIYVE